MRKAYIELHIAVFLAGFTAILGKLIILNEGILVWYRLLITSVLLGAFLLWKNRMERMRNIEMLKVFGVGAVITFHWLMFYGSIKYGNISVALVCLSASGFFSALIEPLILRKKIVPFELLMGMMAIAGIYIIFDFHPQYKLGIVFGILSALGASIFPILNKQLLASHNPRSLTFYELSGGLIFLTLALPLYLKFFPAEYYFPTTSDWVWLCILAVICTIIAFELQLHALKRISAFTVNLSFNLEPIYGIILAFIFFGESKSFHNQFYIGLLLIILAVVFQMLRLKQRQFN